MGVEDMAERRAILKALHEAHDEDEHAYPAQYCADLFEELNAAWVEAVPESRRRFLRTVSHREPRFEDLKLLFQGGSIGLLQGRLRLVKSTSIRLL